MEVELISHTSLSVCARAIRTCYNSFSKSDTDLTKLTDNLGEKDRRLIYNVGNKFRHGSVLEHLNYSFSICGISRAVLQELARHRHSSFSVKSTRYTLAELKKEENFSYAVPADRERAQGYLVFTGNKTVDSASVAALNNLKSCLVDGIKNDIAKSCLPENYKTSLVWSINARSLQNFLLLRTDKHAYEPIRGLAYKIYLSLPTQHKYLFKEIVLKEEQL